MNSGLKARSISSFTISLGSQINKDGNGMMLAITFLFAAQAVGAPLSTAVLIRAIILSLILMIFRRTRRYGTAMLIGLTIGALITNCCLKILIARARPYSEETAAFFNTDLYQKLWLTVGQNVESDKSFPSGHTTAAFASMTALFLTGNKKYSWTAFIFAFLMAVARIYLVVHFASDVVAGIVVGVVAGILASLIAKKIPAGYYNSDWPFRKKEEGGKHVRVG